MAKSKAKWLAEATTRELVVLMKECIKDEDFKKVNKIITELLERIPEEDGIQSVEEAVEKAKKDLDAILEAYNQEAAAVVAEDEEEEEVKKPSKKKHTRKPAKSSEESDLDEDEDEDEEEEDWEDEDEEDEEEDEGYEDMTQGELKRELRRRGIMMLKRRITKSSWHLWILFKRL